MPGKHYGAAAKMNHSAPAKKHKAAPKMKHSSPTEMKHAAPTKNLKKGYHGVKPNPPANMGSAYKMKNSVLHMGAKHGTPIHANYGSPAKMPDFSGDGKITQKDVLMGRGVIPKPPSKMNHSESPADMGHSSPADMHGKSPAKKKEKTKGIIGAHGDIQSGEIVYSENVGSMPNAPEGGGGEGGFNIYRNDPDNMRVTVTSYKPNKSSNVKENTFDATDKTHSVTHDRNKTTNS